MEGWVRVRLKRRGRWWRHWKAVVVLVLVELAGLKWRPWVEVESTSAMMSAEGAVVYASVPAPAVIASHSDPVEADNTETRKSDREQRLHCRCLRRSSYRLFLPLLVLTILKISVATQ
jgi:hypothetical protein